MEMGGLFISYSFGAGRGFREFRVILVCFYLFFILQVLLCSISEALVVITPGGEALLLYLLSPALWRSRRWWSRAGAQYSLGLRDREQVQIPTACHQFFKGILESLRVEKISKMV